ncbi:hypothetical protein ARMSODRAFT_456435 [Armillaria solidipes]|uniref:Uncharacterized protein n=1 Tax=Armillaria solidipes TaxID=1076256 RepID=A0A2H3BEZ9_9AGAR|nr:hypothetical protein ARMSODRAFT_456435 [Armillaria solidipes]
MKMSSLSSGRRSLYEIWNWLPLDSVSSSLRDIKTAALSWFKVVFLGLRDGHTAFAQDVTSRTVALPGPWCNSGHEDSLTHMLPCFPPLANTPVVACPKFLTLQKLNRSLPIPLNSPWAAKSFDFTPPESAALSHFPGVTIVDIFSRAGRSTIYCQNTLGLPCASHLRVS